jgi:hypothetical protein
LFFFIFVVAGGATQQKVIPLHLLRLGLFFLTHVDLGAKMASGYLKVVLSVLVVNNKNAAAF